MFEIVGLSVRVPGASNKDALWSLLRSERNSITEIPKDRWSHFRYEHPRVSEQGKAYTFKAGVLDDLWDFDPSVFGISPREAEQMDPQQRILLQLTWEAIEDAGISPDEIVGENVGVYVGTSALDYASESLFDPNVANGHFMTGNTLSIVSNRLSYIYDLKGPSLTVDTACSSSLVALHEAYLALSSGLIDTAIVAGVNVLASPFPFIGFAQATMLSPDGQCKAFDANGNGYVRSEGGAVLVIRRKDAPRWKGQRSHADIVAVDVNSDGRTIGMSLPSDVEQAKLLERIYQKHDIDPNQLAFIEAHGTGTRVGDPAEAGSIGRTLAQKRSAPLPIGSIKTNVGHLEPASGLVGLIKSVLALQNDYFPASLHFKDPNPDIDFETLNIQVAAEGVSLTREETPRYAGINSFGFGGTNAHVILTDPVQSAYEQEEQVEDGAATHSLLLSAPSKEALVELAKAYSNSALLDDLSIRDVCATSYHRKRLFLEKAIFQAQDATSMQAALSDFAEGQTNSRVDYTNKSIGSGKCAFAFSGNGAQWAGMGRDAYAFNDTFRATIEKVDALFENLSGWSLKTELFSETLEEDLQKTSRAQPLLFAIQVALCQAMQDYAVTPDIVLGHSIGEVAAAYVAGAITLEGAVKLVYHRSVEQEAVAGQGTMAALVLPAEEARRLIAESGFTTIEVAAENSPKSVSLSGSCEELDSFAKYARENHVAFKRVALNYPFHSELVETVEHPFRNKIGTVVSTSNCIPYISTVTGSLSEGQDLNADYWWQNLRRPVLFSKAVATAIDLGADIIIEIGPKPILQSYLRQVFAGKGVNGSVLQSLPGEKIIDIDPVLNLIARAFLAGIKVDTDKLFGSNPDKPVALVGLPWQNKSYRFENSCESNMELFRGGEHPLLGWRPNANYNLWTTHLDRFTVPFLQDHVINGQMIFPGAGYVEMALAAGKTLFETSAVELRSLDIVQAMVLSDEFLTEVQTEIFAETGTVKISSRMRLSGDDWTLHAVGRVGRVAKPAAAIKVDYGSALLVSSGHDIYDDALKYGLEFGPSFQRAQTISQIDESTFLVHLAALDEDKISSPFGIHPAELDGCFHGLLALFREADSRNNRPKAYVPIYFENIRQYLTGVSPAYVQIKIKRASALSILADFQIFDETDRVIIEISGGRFRATELGRKDSPSDLIYRIEPALVRDRAAQNNTLAQSFSPTEEYVTENFQIASDDAERETYLLLNAAAQRAAFDILSKFVDNEQNVEVDSFPIHHRRYFVNLLTILENAGAVTECGNGRYELTTDFEIPEFDLLIASILEESPQDIAAATLLSISRKRVLDGVGHGALEEDSLEHSSAMLEQYWFSSCEAKIRKDCLAQRLKSVLSDWDINTPLRVLDLGGSGLGLARDILQIVPHNLVQICILDNNHKSAARLAAGVVDEPNITVFDGSDPDKSHLWDAIMAEGPYDIAASSGLLHAALQNEPELFEKLSELLLDGGQFIAIEPPTDIFHDVTFGLTPNWFAASISDHFPVGPLKTCKEWIDQIDDKAFGKPVAIEAMKEGACVVVLQATAIPALVIATEDQAAKLPQSHSIVVVAGNAKLELDIAKALQNDNRLSTCDITVIDADNSRFNLNEASGWEAALLGVPLLEAELKTIVHLYGLAETGDSPVDQVMKRCATCIGFVKAYPDLAGQLALIAPGGSGYNPQTEAPAQSAAWAFARVFGNEAPELNPVSIDVRLNQDASGIASDIIEALLYQGHETEFHSTQQSHAVSRVKSGFGAASLQAAENVELCLTETGSINHLSWRNQLRVEPSEGDVEVLVAATGLNFRDVMWTLGLLPEEALEDGYGGPNLGLEISGTVTRVGSDVSGLTVGDKVVAFTSGGYSSYVTCPQFAVAKLNQSQELISAATYPVAFLTAYYSLIHLGDLKADQWVLIHGGAGGVGLAALQIAKHVGAKIIATAGTEEKREILRLLGADYTMDSRNLEFPDEVMELTDGKGVHAVLNSLAGEAMEASINVVRPFGRFLELGKRDYYANTKIGLRPFRRNVSYFGIDLDQILLHDSELARKLIEDVFALIKDGTFTPLPYLSFEGRDVQDAFRLMQRSGHIGKILITPPKPNEIKVPQVHSKLRFSSEGHHIVIGGLGGFGLEICRWLADNGAQRITLTSRSATISDLHQNLIETLAGKGISVSAVSCDVTDRTAVHNMLSAHRDTAPIKNIIHAAMVLDDGIMQQLDEARFRKVLEPKVQGASLLNELTAQDELDQFILFSSATTLVGNPGQSHYVAANGYLEGLARARRQAGKPAIAVGWGAIGDVGFLARNKDVSGKLSRHLGEATINAREGLDILQLSMEQDDGRTANAVIYIGRFAWASAHQSLPLLSKPLFKEIVARSEAGNDGEGKTDIMSLIDGKTDADAKKIVAHLLAGEISHILRLPVEDISFQRPLAELGMDSLMGLELRMGVKKRFDLEIPLTSISGGTCLDDFATQILQKLRKREIGEHSKEDGSHSVLASQHLSNDLDEGQQSVVRDILDTQHNKTARILN
ncbi:type I polyketide synthase [Pseudovibrio sp. Tun.PSC04-5.I4]|uniref:type I polyketide synthase n=1 Tax=Pseudovibrio sp. Tun.PSC04-5.I4 TaxID=1798213 RepID=UPI00089120E6|nr:type I polyketide synthase [Pseudovibrio sp. Tun.PSC04-5.I4]SDR44876.1 Acyl transferase domain-containing protein [Pseudovibrio sp. Tun.PSC04-5.I4]